MRILQGIVVSTKNPKTLIVEVERQKIHPLYQKIIRRSKRYKIHYLNQKIQVGDRVKFRETRPISKDKHYILLP